MITTLTVIGTALMIILYAVKALYENNAEKKKVQDEQDKKIDDSNDADSLLKRLSE